MEGLLWPTVPPIRSHRNGGCRPVWYNLMHTNTKWRMHPPAFRPPFLTVRLQTLPTHFHTQQLHCDTCLPNLWLVRQRKNFFSHWRRSLQCEGYRAVPTYTSWIQTAKDVDMMKWSFLRDLFVSTLLDFYLCCTANGFRHALILTMVQCWTVNV